MLLGTTDLAKILRMSTDGARRLVHGMGIPFNPVGNRFVFDTSCDTFQDFWESIHIAMRTDLPVLYSLQMLAAKVGKDKKTVYRLLKRNNVTIHKHGRKNIVLLVDLLRFQSQLTTNAEETPPNEAQWLTTDQN